jgi:hypothetical protein
MADFMSYFRTNLAREVARLILASSDPSSTPPASPNPDRRELEYLYVPELSYTYAILRVFNKLVNAPAHRGAAGPEG